MASYIVEQYRRGGRLAKVEDQWVPLDPVLREALALPPLQRGFGCRYAGKVPAKVLQKLMRHSSIAITMGYYAHVDDAVMEAVLGPQCNSSRNTQAKPGQSTESPADTTPDQQSTSEA